MLVAYGFSQISRVLIYPLYENLMEQHSLESGLRAVKNSIQNIGYQFTYRGINPPKKIKYTLDILNQEKDDIEYKISKLNRRDVRWWVERTCLVFCGCLGIALSFAVICGLLVVLIEQTVLSTCKWECGFSAFTRAHQVLIDIAEIVPLIYPLFAAIYLFNLCMGISSMYPSIKSVSTSGNYLLLISLIISLASFSAPIFMHELFPLTMKKEVLPLASYFSHWTLCTVAFCFSIYWNFFKCKDRSKL